MKNNDKSIKKLYTIAVILGVFAYIFLMYPTLSNAWNKYVSSKQITIYKEAIVDNSSKEKLEKEFKRADAYNKKLFSQRKGKLSEYIKREKDGIEDKEYESIFEQNGMMGYVDIPKINVKLPIRHYSKEEVLKNGVGHLYGSSLPVGGESTHAVITAHNALPSAKLFTDLDKLKSGDKFAINIGDRVLKYEVDQINTVLPNELEPLEIEEGKDYITLLTCTPYGVNTHRLLVRGKRLPDDAHVEKNNEDKTIEEVVNAPIFLIVISILILVGAVFAIYKIWKKK